MSSIAYPNPSDPSPSANTLPDFARTPQRAKPNYRGQQIPGYVIISGGMTSSALFVYALLRHYEAPGFEPGISIFDGSWFGNVGKMMLTLAFGFGLKHVIQYAFISDSLYDLAFALNGALIHIMVESTSTYAYISRWRAGKMSSASGPKQYVALAVLTVAAISELRMEYNRMKWKQDPRNKGKVYDKGAFAICRHPNFLCFALYRILSNPLASGSWVPMAFMSTWIGLYYPTTGIKELEQYMEWKYSEHWKTYCKRVRWQLVPYLW